MLKNRKILWSGAGLLVVAAAILVFIFVVGKDEKPVAKANPTKDTCKVLTLKGSYFLLGSSTQKDDAKSASSTTPVNGVLTNTCTYSQSGVPEKSGKLSASVTVKEAQTDEAAATLKKDFDNAHAKYTDLNGVYGDKDFWDYDKAQINVLKGDKWYILTFGKLDPNARNLSQTEELADMLVGKY